MNSNFMRFNFYEHFTAVISEYFSSKIFRTWYLMWLFYHTYLLLKLLGVGFCFMPWEGKNIFWSFATFFKEATQSVIYLKSKFCNFKYCFKNKLYLPIPHFSHLSATFNKMKHHPTSFSIIQVPNFNQEKIMLSLYCIHYSSILMLQENNPHPCLQALRRFKEKCCYVILK